MQENMIMKELNQEIRNWVLNLMDDYECELTSMSFLGSSCITDDKRMLATILVRDVWVKVLQDHDEVNSLSLDDFQTAVKTVTTYIGSPMRVEGMMHKIERDVLKAIG
jgi:hypothetical protein